MRRELKAFGCALLLVLATDCFPEVTFTSTGATSTGSGGGKTTSSSHTASGSTTTIGSTSSSATSVSTVGVSVTVGTAGYCKDTCYAGHGCTPQCGTNPDCDCDGDGQKAMACTTSSTGGSDCYDCNANAKHGQTTYFDVDRGDGRYDYDCNGTDDKEFDDKGACGSPVNGACPYQVFLGTTDCGKPGELYDCACTLLCMACQVNMNSHSGSTQKCR